jgi:hypothetical protein
LPPSRTRRGRVFCSSCFGLIFFRVLNFGTPPQKKTHDVNEKLP